MPADAPRPRNRYRAETRLPARERTVRVTAITDVAPGLRRVHLADPGGILAGGPTAFDDVVVLFFPDPSGELTATDRAREYTVRGHDPVSGELRIDFALHDGGLADGWVRSARVGDALGISGPRMCRALPGRSEVLAIGDATAIPALARLLEDIPSGVRLRVVIVAEPARLAAALPADTADLVAWVDPTGDPVDALLAALNTMPVPADTWAWVAGESALVGAARRTLLDVHGLHRDQIQFTGYWKRDTAR